MIHSDRLTRWLAASGRAMAGVLWPRPERSHPWFDAVGAGRGDRGARRLVVALGDPATARHLAVIVPGVGIDLNTFDDPEHPARRPYGMALALRELAPDTAVVAWLGYRPPAGLGYSAAAGDSARVGAAALRSFVRRLRAGAAPGATLALVCHSYGSVVCGVAAAGLPVDDLVFLASPGVRADSASALRSPARVWVASATTDWIRRVPHVRLGDLGHGPDPAAPAFGARTLPTAGVSGHEGYFAPGSSTLRAVADLVSGRAEAGPGTSATVPAAADGVRDSP